MLRFSNIQLEKLSDICSNIGLVALASVALPAILDKTDALLMIVGLATSFVFWLISLWLIKSLE